MWPVNEQLGWKPYGAIAVQVWEMVSLFVLFSFFYKKSYGDKKKNNSTGRSIKSVGVEELAKVGTAAFDAAAKDAKKVVSTASKVPPVQAVMDATKKPSWSIVN